MVFNNLVKWGYTSASVQARSTNNFLSPENNRDLLLPGGRKCSPSVASLNGGKKTLSGSSHTSSLKTHRRLYRLTLLHPYCHYRCYYVTVELWATDSDSWTYGSAAVTLECKWTWSLFRLAILANIMLMPTVKTFPRMTLSAAQMPVQRNESNNWFRPIETSCASLPSPARPKLISIRIAACRANHTSMLEWNIFRREDAAKPQWYDSGSGRKAQMEKMQIWKVSGHLHFVFHHSTKNSCLWLGIPISLVCGSLTPALLRLNLILGRPEIKGGNCGTSKWFSMGLTVLRCRLKDCHLNYQILYCLY